jgi:hypothetical protein
MFLSENPSAGAWVRIASSVRGFGEGTLAKVRTLEAMRTQALSSFPGVIRDCVNNCSMTPPENQAHSWRNATIGSTVAARRAGK